MFQIADECYAMENAMDELKEIATGIIGSNNDDGVAKWLLQNCACPIRFNGLPVSGERCVQFG